MTLPRQHYTFWWEALDALPPSRTAASYARLARIWMDQTRPCEDKVTGKRGQELTAPDRETHLTVALWEQFELLPAAVWLPALWARGSLRTPLGEVRRVNWSYGWNPGPGRPSCDIVLQYEDERGLGVLVVEAKNLGKRLERKKDRDPAYYLDLPLIRHHERRSMLYLVSESVREASAAAITATEHDYGVCSWEQLAEIQIAAALLIDGPAALRAFVAAAMRRAFTDRGIAVAVPPLPYLAAEPTAVEVVAKTAACGPMKDWSRPLWRLE